MTPRLSLRLLVAVVAGLVLTAMFEPVGLVVAGPLGVAGYALALRGARVRTALLVSLVFGAVFSFVQLWWMQAVGMGAWIALSLIETAYFLILGPVVALLHRLRAWPVLVAPAWVAYEELRAGWPFGGFPWARLSFGVVDTPFAALLPWIGMPGVSLVLALLATTSLWAALRLRDVVGPLDRAGLVRRAKLVTAPVAILVLVGVVAALTAYAGPTDGERVRVAAVQGDVGGDGDDVVAVHRQVTRDHATTTEELAADVAAGDVDAPAFAVWPENSTAVDPFTDGEAYREITRAVAALGVPVLVGGMVDAVSDEQVLNQGIVWDPVSGPGDRYAKHHPVPFGEYIPFRNDTLTDIVEQFDLIPRDMLAGVRRSPLDIEGVAVANAICFDVAYDDLFHDQVAAGAQLVTVQTSNAMFIRTHQIDQQFEITRLRAIATGKYVVVAAINGRSGIIAPDGSVVADIGTRERGVVAADVVLNDDVPPGLRIGPWLARGAFAATLLAVLLALVTSSRRIPTVGRSAADRPRGTVEADDPATAREAAQR